MERALVERTQIPYRSIDTGQLRGVGTLTAIKNGLRMGRGLWQALAQVRQFRPDVCLATGGYVCGPVILACWLRGIPVLIYLPDVTPGWAIQSLSRLATRVAVTLPAAAAHFGGEAPAGKAVVTGYPVRPEIVAAARDRSMARHELADALKMPLDDELPLVLVHGASQGARSINRAVWQMLPQVLPHARLLHCIGTRDWAACAAEREASMAALPPELADRYHPVDYLHDSMALALAGSDLCVARAGASVLGELPVARLPAILVPLPFAGVNQRPNAQSLAEQGAALVVEDDALGQELAPALLSLLQDEARRRGMESALAALAKPNAAAAIAQELHRLGGGVECQELTAREVESEAPWTHKF